MELKNVRRTNAFFLGLILVYLATELFITVLSARDIELSLISSLVLSQGIMLVPALLFIVIFRLDVRTWVPMRRLKASTLGFTLLFTLCISPFVTWINILSQLFTTNIVAELAEELLSSPPLPLLLIIGIVGPFCEELTFRGVIFHGLKFSGRILASILVSGLFFGLMHMNLNQLSYAVILGIAFAFLTEATGSILPSFLVHVLVNSSNIGLELLIDFIYSRFNIEGLDSLTEAIENTEISRNEIFLAAGAYMIPALVGLALSIVVFIAICRREGSLEHIQGLFQSKKERKDLPVLTVTGWIAIGICAVIITAMDLLMKLFSLFVAG